mmetsp:Transcript_43887/g.87212  ORF Transcript_43887/g.87212 Transcript_43887/m.87212 type:complete len:196 (-) Transcript_43887:133-720(-)|eukprot:CAMPEP_0170363346 /NCGR_PEP_ID=MMETSP0117_2-20130122/4808_1 /TAXON_ID=400756 /ORGANISM="Durinskia baltica, Strain CSIRO CS-38" /LENGTH=195 /DNA_ID=CAMNT_0010617807 /DNA_START=18 /DNA_END=605 /DNA_ORIENTATION=+
MSVSAWENFLGTDWQRYSQIAVKASCVGCAAIGVMAIMFNAGILIGLWILWASVFLAILEYPNLFVFVPNFDSYREFMLERLLLKLDEVKAIACFSFSLFCFMNTSITVIAGLGLMVTAVLLAFAAVNRRVDAADEAAAQGGGISNEGPSSFMGSNTFQYQPVTSNEGSMNPHTGLPAGQLQQKQGVVLGSYQNA